MTIVLKKGEPVEEMKKKLNEALSQRSIGINTSKYFGTLKTQIDPLEYQRKMRDEWE